MSIRQARGLRFHSADIAGHELTFQGTLGATKYNFDTAACERDFGLRNGVLYEFYFDAGANNSSASVNNASFDGGAAQPGSPLLLPPKNKDSQAYLGRYFIAVGPMKTPLDMGDEGGGNSNAAASNADKKKNKDDGGGEGKEGAASAAEAAKEAPPLYIFDVEDLSLFCLAEATSAATLRERYPLRPVAEENARRFNELPGSSVAPSCPYGFSVSTLASKYYVRSGEEVYLATLGERAVVIGEAFGCLWVRLGGFGSERITALGKATNEARLVTLYGLSDISNAPSGGGAGGAGAVVTPRSVQTPRAGGQGGQPQPPYVLNKRTADGKPAVLCNCTMNQQVLAVCTADALKVFGVKPMSRLFFTLGVDAGKSATILGVRNGSLYIHMDGDAKCTCLRNATNAEELREKYTGAGGPTSSSYSANDGPPTASAATMPRDLPKEVGSGGASSGSPLNIPKLSLGSIGSKLGGMFGGDGDNKASVSPARTNSPSKAGTAAAAAGASPAAGGATSPRNFYFWTAHGCLGFDVSVEGCKPFNLRHGQTVRFSAGVDAGCIFHVVGVRGGNIWVVPDRGDLAIPLRHCADGNAIAERVGPVLVGTTRLRPADPRGVPPLQQTLRSPDRRAGSPFGISPRNTTTEDEEGKPIEFGRLSQPNSASRTARDLNFGGAEMTGSVGAEGSTNFVRSRSSGGNSAAEFGSGAGGSARTASPPKLAIQKSVSPGSLGAREASHEYLSTSRSIGGAGGSFNNNSSSASGMSMQREPSNNRGGAASASLMEQSVSSYDLISKPAMKIHVPGSAAADGGSAASAAANNSHGAASPAADRLSSTNPINRNTIIPPPGPVTTEAFKAGNMPSTRNYLKAIALRALACKREADMPTAFFRFFSHDAGTNMSRALQDLTKFRHYWDAREKPMRGGRAFDEATVDMMVEALENLAQLRGE